MVAPVENRGRTDDEEPDNKPPPAVKAVDGPVNLLESSTSESIGTSKIKNKRQVPTLECVSILFNSEISSILATYYRWLLCRLCRVHDRF